MPLTIKNYFVAEGILVPILIDFNKFEIGAILVTRLENKSGQE
jgi:hypothetical protein